MSTTLLSALGRILGDTIRAGLHAWTRDTTTSSAKTRRTPSPTARDTRPTGEAFPRYPGDYPGMPQVSYSPVPGKNPDPGEVVWTWVPYEEDHAKGKDRPVVLVGRDGDWLLGVPLSSVDHEADADQEAGEGRHWTAVGTGAWDSKRRPSQARVDRVIRVHPDDVRGRAEKLDKPRFDKVAAAVRRWT